jgi:CRISPR-associated protein Cas2
LSSYGDRVNYSVFELNIRAHILSQLKLKLKELMDKNDSVRVYILNKTSAESAVELGSYREKPFELEASYV